MCFVCNSEWNRCYFMWGVGNKSNISNIFMRIATIVSIVMLMFQADSMKFILEFDLSSSLLTLALPQQITCSPSIPESSPWHMRGFVPGWAEGREPERLKMWGCKFSMLRDKSFTWWSQCQKVLRFESFMGVYFQKLTHAGNCGLKLNLRMSLHSAIIYFQSLKDDVCNCYVWNEYINFMINVTWFWFRPSAMRTFRD